MSPAPDSAIRAWWNAWQADSVTETTTRYFRRAARRSGWWHFVRGRRRYEVWVPDARSVVVSLGKLDQLLAGRRFPADFWAAVNEADHAFESGDRSAWIESGTGRRMTDPPVR